MPRSQSVRRVLLALAGLMAMLGAGAATADAEYGELGSPITETGKVNEEGPHAFGVDPTDNSFYVGDGVKGTEEYRIQKFSSSGAALAEIRFKANENSLLLGSTALEGITIDTAAKRLYMLVDRKREAEGEEPLFDPELPAAATLYAFSTEVKNGEKKLEPASGTKAGGVLAELNPQSEASKVALLDPHGIAVDPTNHDVVIVGQQDESTKKGAGEEQLRAAVQRVHTEGANVGKLGPRYVDKENCLDGGVVSVSGGEPACGEGRSVEKQPFSPIVSSGGKVLVERRGEVWEIPPATGSEPKRLLPTALKIELEQEFIEVPDGEVAAEEVGSTMSFVPEGASGEGKLYLTAKIASTTAGVLVLDYAEHGGTPEAKELGWTGGGSESSGAKCALPKVGNEALLVAGAKNEDIFVFDAHEEGGIAHPAGVDVFELGPAGVGCPHASATVPSIKVEGKTISPVPLSKVATLSSEMTEANAKSVEWKFKDLTTGKEEAKTTAEETEAKSYQFQTTNLQHTFEEAGEHEIVEIIETDDLASPTIEVKQKVMVTTTPLAVEFSYPASTTVGAAAKLEATVTDPHEPGTPHLKYVWKFGDGAEKTGETTSKSFSEEHTYLAEGAKSMTLKVTDAHGVSGEVTHTISVGESEQRKKEEEAAARKHQEEEAAAAAAARKHQEEEAAAATAAQKHQEEEAAARKHAEEEAAAKKGVLGAKEEGSKSKPPTRAQLLAKALKTCKKQPKKKRAKCEATARKKYGSKAKVKKHKK